MILQLVVSICFINGPGETCISTTFEPHQFTSVDACERIGEGWLNMAAQRLVNQKTEITKGARDCRKIGVDG